MGKKCYKNQNSGFFLPSDLEAAKYNSARSEAAGQLSTTTVE